MITKELVDFIKAEQAKGVVESDIRFLLTKNGWNSSDIDEAYRSMNPIPPVPNPSAPLSPSQPSNFSQPLSPLPTLNPIPETKFFQNQVIAQPHKKKKALLFVSIFIVLLIVAGAGYAYVSGYFTSLSQVTSKAFDSMSRAQSASFDVTFSFESTSTPKEGQGPVPESDLMNLFGGKTSITVKGEFDKSNLENILLNNTLSFQHQKISGELEMRLVDNVFYANLTKAPIIDFIPMISEYSNRWFSFNLKNSETGKNMLPANMFGMDLDSVEGISEEEKEHIYQLTRNANFIVVKEKLSPETIGGTLSYHFTFDLDRSGITNYLTSLRDYVQEIGKDDSRLSSFDPTDFSEGLDKIENFQGEAWIGRKDNLLRKIDISFNTSEDYSSSVLKNDFRLIGIYDNWGEAISVSVPEGAVDFKTFLEQGPLGEAQRKGLEASYKAKVSSLRATAEIQFDSTYPNPSYKGVCELPDFISVRDSLQTEGLSFQCEDSKNAYYIATKFESAEIYCVDSTGFAGVVPENPEIREKLTCNP